MRWLRNKLQRAQQPYQQQWGAERSTTPLPMLHGRPSDFAIAYSRIAIVLTIVFWTLYASSVVIRQLMDGPQSYAFTTEALGYALIVTFLTLSALLYLIARHGALQAFTKHRRVPQRVLDEHFATHPSSVTVLVPSYNEEVSVVRKTLLSAALQETPDLKIVLLVDDNPFPTNDTDRARLDATFKICTDIETLLAQPRATALALRERMRQVTESNTGTLNDITTTYRSLAEWLETTADTEVIEDHVDIFFAEEVLRALATELRESAAEIEQLYRSGNQFTPERLQQLANRVVWIFSAKLSHFERKRYQSLSHEPNKAMNLNSYIGLMGNAYRVENTADGTILMETLNQADADLTIPDSDYILTLDADSILLRGYCSRLIYYIEEPQHTDVAVVQTPYSSFRGAPSRLERLSGATTDIQHILHQGMSYYGAAFWVGANAVIRKVALKDIVETEYVGGFEIKRFVQDHTVIEDTESSIDLALRDWRILSYPERMSYSATPPDFGSLTVQRLRWANGGLLIFPKLLKLRHQRKHQGRPLPLITFLLRTNYMASIAWSSVGLLLLLAYPYDGRLLSPLVLLAAATYFIAMAMDLRYCGYKYSDILRIYGFNLILLPVNMAGTFKSLQQAITTKKIPFARTPKVKNRTATNWWYLIAPLLIIGFSLFTLWRNIEGQNWGNAAFAGFNAFTASWAVVSYIGIRNLLADLWAAFIDWLYIEVPVRPVPPQRSWSWPTIKLPRRPRILASSNQ
jgi:cellulose synthase/poly-beta-1,6-N-acetylglucosamine synthase-like glycosyltransferase